MSAVVWLLATLFVVAGLAKIIDLPLFESELRHVGLVPAWSVPFIAGWLPWFELCCGCGLMSQTFRTGSAWACAGLSGAFVVVSLVGLATNASTFCGCLGALPIGWNGLPWLWHAVIAAALLLLSLAVALVPQRRMPVALGGE